MGDSDGSAESLGFENGTWVLVLTPSLAVTLGTDEEIQFSTSTVDSSCPTVMPPQAWSFHAAQLGLETLEPNAQPELGCTLPAV